MFCLLNGHHVPGSRRTAACRARRQARPGEDLLVDGIHVRVVVDQELLGGAVARGVFGDQVAAWVNRVEGQAAGPDEAIREPAVHVRRIAATDQASAGSVNARALPERIIVVMG